MIGALRTRSRSAAVWVARLALASLVLVACAPGELRVEGGSPDRSDVAAADRPGEPCALDLDCAGSKVCLGGTCQDDPCTPDACAAGQECQAACVPSPDASGGAGDGGGSGGTGGGLSPGARCDGSTACGALVCTSEETCVGGRCVPGCYPSSGSGSGGAGAMPCDGLCPDGTVCRLGCFAATPSPSAAVDCGGCGSSEVCVAGTCVVDLCAGIDCGGTSTCDNGTCVDTCDCGHGCDAGERCELGRCVTISGCGGAGDSGGDDCVSECDGLCGSSDGCGGTCFGICEDGFVCKARRDGTEHSCECATTCSSASACGDDDGCGGTCDGDCARGSICTDLGCCVPSCDGSCGSDDGCGGTCFGTCETGLVCKSREDGREHYCACDPVCPPDPVCGAPDGCGGRCDGSCSSTERCHDGRCECAPSCASTGACGAPDGCGGRCERGTCGSGLTCRSGRCEPVGCEPACGCGEVCSAGTCIPVCRPGETLCTCNTCCAAGETCSGGRCVSGGAPI